MTLSGLYSYGVRDNFAQLNYVDYNEFDNMIANSTRIDNEGEDSETIEFALNYVLKFEEEGHELTFNTNFIQDEDLEQSDIIQSFSNISNNIDQISSNLEFERNQLYQFDYIYPFNKDGKVESGLKTTIREINNEFWFKELNENNEYEFVDEINNNFVFNENIYAAYIMASNKINNFAWQLGLRSEYADIKTRLKLSDYSNPRIYFNFFPSVHFSYKFSQLSSIQTSYSRRIQRPRFRFLMPISSFSDNRNFWIGNPDLDPEFSDSYDLGYLLNWENGSILTNVFYRYSTDIIQRITFIDDEGTTFITPENIGKQNDFGTEININYEPFDWWDLSFNVNSFYVEIFGNSSVGDLDANSWVTNFKFNTKFKLFWGINLSMNYNYRGPMELPQGRLNDIWFIDFAMSKDITENLTLTLNGSDIFSTRMRRMITRDVDYYFNQDFQWRGGIFTFNITYRLNQEKDKRHIGSSSFDDE